MSAVVAISGQSWRDPAATLTEFPLRLLHAWINAPVLLFLLALTAMLFRPPDLKTLPVDRIAFLLLAGCLSLRLCVQREHLQTYPATWPMLALLLLSLWGVVSEPYNPQSWSLLATKWFVPFVLFHAAGLIFGDEKSFRRLEIFCLATLFYLSIISVFYLVGANALIFPRFILDQGIGIHADRARGPFLQAVANGVSLNILGLIALDSFRRKTLPWLLAVSLFFAVPLALLATKTRAVWFSAAFSAVVLLFFRNSRVRIAALAFGILGAIVVCFVLLRQNNSHDFAERFRDQSPVDFRTEVYQAGWQMFLEKPLIGWGSDDTVQIEVARRVSDFHPEYYVFHNTFLELAVSRGLLGLGLYTWLIVCLFRLRGHAKLEIGSCFLDSDFRRLWVVILGAYLLNASAVVMNYQFVNGLLFTFAGILAAQCQATNRRDIQLARQIS